MSESEQTVLILAGVCLSVMLLAIAFAALCFGIDCYKEAKAWFPSESNKPKEKPKGDDSGDWWKHGGDDGK